MGQLRERLLISGLSVLPKNAMSRAVGSLAHMKLPRLLSSSSIRAFARVYGININEAESTIDSYGSIGEFFARRLKVGSRVIDHRPGHIVSPADGTILNAGQIQNDTIIQAKGRHFTVTELLGSKRDAARYNGGFWVTIYLSPKDYHRVHHPVEGQISRARYFPGSLWPVNQAAVNHVERLFCVNERLATFVKSPLGLVTTVMVGATSVGYITVRYDKGLRTNKDSRGGEYHYPDGQQVARGDELGTFHLGSTVIVLAEAKGLKMDTLETGQTVRIGESLGRIAQK
ncbi:MAG: archaetidylserine decarboxylase [Bradymonadia bacterium]